MHRLRLATLNLWGLERDIGARLHHVATTAQQLRLDVLLLQEVKPWPQGDLAHGAAPSPTTAHWLADKLGWHCAYRTATAWPAGAWGPASAAGEEGLAIISRLPLADVRAMPLPEARPLETRILLSALLDTAAGPIWAHTSHLHYRLDDGVAREAQVLAIDDAIRGLGRDNASAPQLLGGDFNAPPDADEVRFLRGLCTLGGRRTHFQDAYLRHHVEASLRAGEDGGFTWSQDNPYTRPLRSLDIGRRIDYLFVTSRKRDGRATVWEAGRGFDAPDAAGHWASDHFGVWAEVQIGADE